MTIRMNYSKLTLMREKLKTFAFVAKKKRLGYLIYKLTKVFVPFFSSSKGKGHHFLPHQCQLWVVHPYWHHQILVVHLTRTWLTFQLHYLLRHCCLTPPLHPFPVWCLEPWMKWKTHEKIIIKRRKLRRWKNKNMIPLFLSFLSLNTTQLSIRTYLCG